MIVSATASLRSMLGQGPQPSRIQLSFVATSSSFRFQTRGLPITSELSSESSSIQTATMEQPSLSKESVHKSQVCDASHSSRDQSISSSHSAYNNLSTELLHEIVKYCNAGTLKNLRLTCTLLKTLAEPRVFVTTNVWIKSEESLRDSGAWRVAEHPVLRNYPNHLTCDFLGSGIDMREYPRERTEKDKEEEENWEIPRPRVFCQDYSRKEFVEMLGKYLGVYPDQVHKFRQKRQLLRTILRNCRGLSSVTAVNSRGIWD